MVFTRLGDDRGPATSRSQSTKLAHWQLNRRKLVRNIPLQQPMHQLHVSAIAHNTEQSWRNSSYCCAYTSSARVYARRQGSLQGSRHTG